MAGETSRGIAILGSTGYAGSELVRLLAAHPHARLIALGAHSHAGKAVAEALPSLPFLQHTLEDHALPHVAQKWRARGVDTVFACLPHGVFAAQAASFLAAGLRIIDLSGDFRLRDAAAFQTHYHMAHPAPELLGEAVYALCEWSAADLTTARLVSNPGCYATAMLLSMLPAAQAGWLDAHAPLLVTAMSGVSGAGRGGKLATQLAECGGSVSPYRVGESHAHIGEVGQMLRALSVRAPVVFNPHLVPMARGIAATVSLTLAQPVSQEQAQALYAQVYAKRPFVHVLPAPMLPETRFVRTSNRCDLAVRVAAGGRLLQVFAALDNLVKGAAGQAVQNFNRMNGWPDDCGLPVGGIACA